MEIDTSILWRIAKKPEKSPLNGEKPIDGDLYPLQANGQGSGQNGGNLAMPDGGGSREEKAGGLAYSYRAGQSQAELASRICAEHQRAIEASGDTRQRILKGTEAGESMESLLLIACQGIAAMTGDSAFMTAMERRLKKA